MLHNFCNAHRDDQEHLEEVHDSGQIFDQPDPEDFEPGRDPEVTFGRRVPTRMSLLEQYFPH